MHFDTCLDLFKVAIRKECCSKMPLLAIVGIRESLPAKQVQYLCLVIGRHDGPGAWVNIASVRVFEDRSHHCTSVYGVSRLYVILGFLDATGRVLASMMVVFSSFL